MDHHETAQLTCHRAARAGFARHCVSQSQYSECLIGSLPATEELPPRQLPRRLTETKQNGENGQSITASDVQQYQFRLGRVGQCCESMGMETVIPGLSFGGLLACLLVARFVPVPGGHPACCHVVRPTRRQGRIGSRYGGDLSLLAGWLAGLLYQDK